MREKLLMCIAAFLTSVSSAVVQAQAPDLPMKTDFGQAVSDPAGFLPSSGDYTLEVDGTSGQEITVAGGMYKYTPEKTGKVRFAQKNERVHVYEGVEYKRVLTPTFDRVLYPDIFADPDDKTAGTGIYDSRNLLKNPGFEELGAVVGSGENYRAVHWESNGYTYGSASRVRLNTITGSEGSATFFLHGYGNPSDNLSQDLGANVIKANTFYKLHFKVWSHNNENSNKEYTISIGNAVGNASVKSSSFKTGNGKNIATDPTEIFRTGETVPENVFFTLARKNQSEAAISYFDRMTLVEGYTPTGIEGADHPVFLEGTAYAPYDPAVIDELADQIEDAGGLKNEYMAVSVKEALEEALSDAESVLQSPQEEEIVAATEALALAMAEARNSISSYLALNAAIQEGTASLAACDRESSHAEAAVERMDEAIAAAERMHAAATAHTLEVAAAITAVQEAIPVLKTYPRLLTTGESFEWEGKKYTVVGTNLVPNNGFEEGFTHWTDGTWTAGVRSNAVLNSSNFTVTTSDGIHNSSYLTGIKNNGYTGAGSIGT